MVNDTFLTSKQAVADELGMSVDTLTRFLRQYPFHHSGAPGVINGRWRVRRTYVILWWEYVQRQNQRHPDARRLRPEEPPDLAAIKGR
jgi:hypothetical protein